MSEIYENPTKENRIRDSKRKEMISEKGSEMDSKNGELSGTNYMLFPKTKHKKT